jgi:hypothetical protein
MPKTMHLYSGGKSTTRGGGLLTYIHSDLYLITERRVPNVDMEYIYIYIILAPAEYKRIRIALLLIYNNPKTDTNKFVYDIERLVSSLPCGIPAFVTLEKFNGPGYATNVHIFILGSCNTRSFTDISLSMWEEL